MKRLGLITAWLVLGALAPVTCRAAECLQALDALTPGGSRLSKFDRGRVWLKTPDGRAVRASIIPAVPQDAEQVLAWFEKRPGGDVIYDDPKWRDWWVEQARGADPQTRVYKLSLPDGRIGGLVATQDVVDDGDHRPITKIVGIRVSPTFNKQLTSHPVALGVGSALVSHAAVESMERGTDGIGLNASLGAEGFYRKLGLEERESSDKIRRYFFVKGKEARARFLDRILGSFPSAPEEVPLGEAPGETTPGKSYPAPAAIEDPHSGNRQPAPSAFPLSASEKSGLAAAVAQGWLPKERADRAARVLERLVPVERAQFAALVERTNVNSAGPVPMAHSPRLLYSPKVELSVKAEEAFAKLDRLAHSSTGLDEGKRKLYPLGESEGQILDQYFYSYGTIMF